MKKVAVLMFVLFCFLAFENTYAQQRQRVEPINKTTQKTVKSSSGALVPQGSMLIGGTAGFVMMAEDGNNSYILSLAPQFGYFILNNFALGALVSVNKMKDIDPSFGIGPFVRGYLNNGLFGQAKYEFQSVPAILDNVTGSAAGVGVGYAAFLNDAVSIEPILFYNRHFGDLGEFNEFGVQIGVSAYLGR
ncbi:MAG: hypothetical protein IPM47_14240 [Sphingobacteriales bacterium]|nr:MAG: hypothetical protein IPM47_14240 [Sphingobacteriales bacterium]